MKYLMNGLNKVLLLGYFSNYVLFTSVVQLLVQSDGQTHKLC